MLDSTESCAHPQPAEDDDDDVVLVRHPSLSGTTTAGYQLPVPVQLQRHSTGSFRGCGL